MPSLAPQCPLSKTAPRPPPAWPASVPGFPRLSWSLLVPSTARVTVWSLLMLTPHQGASHHISAGSRGRLRPEPSLLCPCPLPFSEFLAPYPPWCPDPVAVSAPPPLSSRGLSLGVPSLPSLFCTWRLVGGLLHLCMPCTQDRVPCCSGWTPHKQRCPLPQIGQEAPLPGCIAPVGQAPAVPPPCSDLLSSQL